MYVVYHHGGRLVCVVCHHGGRLVCVVYHHGGRLVYCRGEMLFRTVVLTLLSLVCFTYEISNVAAYICNYNVIDSYKTAF